MDVFGYHSDPKDYFTLGGGGKMKLNKFAALQVCDMLTERNIYISGLNAGVWRNPGYEERPEYGYVRWPKDRNLSVKDNNDEVKRVIREDCDDMDAFLIWELNCELR